MKKIPSANELCKIDVRNQKNFREGKISKTVYNKRKKRIHGLWCKQTNETEKLKKLMKLKRKK